VYSQLSGSDVQPEQHARRAYRKRKLRERFNSGEVSPNPRP